MKFTSVINGIHQVAFAQRKFIKENALNELTSLFEFEVWISIIIALIFVPIVLTIKRHLKSKQSFSSLFSSSIFHLLGTLMSNSTGKINKFFAKKLSIIF